MEAEQVERIDLVESVRAAGQVDLADERVGEIVEAAVGVVDEDHEGLQEEERHDREVVAEQAPGSEPEQEPEERGRDGDDRDRDLGLQVVARMAAGHDPVEVGAEAEEGDVAEIEQPRETDDEDRKSTRLNSSHSQISYAVFCLQKKKAHT